MINPFRNRIMTDPWRTGGIDIPEIHAETFDCCRLAMDQVRAEGRSASILIYGETGSGKTHLLHRLQHHTLTLPRLHLFAAVRLHTSPNRIWRHLRAGLADSLAKPGKKGRLQLELAFMRRLYLLCRKPTITYPELADLTEVVRAESRLSPDLCRVLVRLMHRSRHPDIFAWLRGHALPESAYGDLGVHPPDDREDPEDAARELVLELCRLAGPAIPVVLSFDQIEALQRYPNDIEGLFRFGQAIRTLHDETGNLLIVTCVQTFFLGELRKAVAVPDYDAMAGREIVLGTLTLEQAMKLVASRLPAAAESPVDRASLLKRMETDLSGFLAGANRTCRAVLSRCAEIYDGLSGEGPMPECEATEGDPPLETFLRNEMDSRLEDAYLRSGPEAMDDLIQGVLPSLFHIRDERCREKDGRHPPDVDMVIACPDGEIGICLCNHPNMNSLAGKLRRLLQNPPDAPEMRLVLMRHPRLRIRSGARKVHQYLQRLGERRVRLVVPSLEALAALSALRSLLNDARSGDLSHGGKPVHEKTVREWFRSRNSGPSRTFMDDVLSPADPLTPEERALRLRLLEILETERIIALTEAAGRMHVDPAALEKSAVLQNREIGYLEGPPAVLFDRIP